MEDQSQVYIDSLDTSEKLTGEVDVFDGNTVFKSSISNLSLIINEDRLLEIFSERSFDVEASVKDVKEEAANYLRNIQWNYKEICVYLIARNYDYNVNLCISQEVSTNCTIQRNYIANTYTLEDMWDIICTLSTALIIEPNSSESVSSTDAEFTFNRSKKEFLHMHFAQLLPFTVNFSNTRNNNHEVDFVCEYKVRMILLVYYIAEKFKEFVQ